MSSHHHRIGARDKAIERHNPGKTSGYPFLGDYKVEKELAHGHGPRPPNLTHPSYMCMRVSGSNIVVDEIAVTGNETLSCAIGEVNPKQPILPQQRALSQFQFTGQRLSFPDNAHSYCLSTHVKNVKTSATHHMQLIIRGSDDGQPSRPGTPRNTPRKALTDRSNLDDGKMLKIRSDPNLDYTLNVSADGNPPLLLPAGSQISIAAKEELLLLPQGEPNHDAILSQKSILLKTDSSSVNPIGVQVGNTNLLALASGTKVSALDAVNHGIVLHPPVIPQLDFAFSLSSDNQMTVFSATCQNGSRNDWKIVLTVPALGIKAESDDGNNNNNNSNNNDGSNMSAMVQFSAAQSVEATASVWGTSSNAASALVSQKIRIPVLNPNAGGSDANANNQNAPTVHIRAKDNAYDNGTKTERKFEAECPPELSASVSCDGMSWYPGIPGITMQDPRQTPVAHVSLVERATQRKLTQLALELPTAVANKISDWIPKLTAALNAGALGDNNNNNNNNDGGNNNDNNTENAIGKLFDDLPPPTNAAEQNLLLALQDAFGQLAKKKQNLLSDTVAAPRFNAVYFPPTNEGETGRFENVRCENAASLSLQTGGPNTQPVVIAPNTSVSAPKQSDPHPAVIIASDLNGRQIAVLELREDASVYSAFSGLRNLNSNNNNSRNAFSNALCFNLGNDPNTLTGFYCADATKMQVGVGGENALPTEVDFRTVVSIANAQKALIRAVDSQGNTINQAIVEGNKSQGNKSLGELWTQLEQALLGHPDASNLRTLKPGSDAWLDELVRVVRSLADPKKTFEIRYRGPNPDTDTATVDCGVGSRLEGISEANPAKVLVSDRMAIVSANKSSSSSSQNDKNRDLGGGEAVSENLIRCFTSAGGDADALRSSLSRLRPVTDADEKIQDGALDILNKINNEKNKNSSGNNHIRFSLPRGTALRNLRCDKQEAVLYATLNGGRRERLAVGETMPPAALQSQTDSMEIEAVIMNNSNNTSTTIGSVCCSFSSENGSSSSSSSGWNGSSAIGFDCEILPDGEQAVVNLTAPDGFKITPRVDGLKGNSLGSRGLVRIDPFASHVIQICLEDAVGRQVLKQNLFFPRICLPKCDFFLENSAIGTQCPRGTKVLAVVDGGPEKTTDQAVSFDCDRPHVFDLRFLGDSISRDGAKEMCRIGEVSFKIPPQFSPADILELCRLLKEHDPTNPGSSSPSHLPPRLSQLATNTKSATIRDIACVVSALCGGGRGNGNSCMSSYNNNQPPLAPGGGNNNIIRPQPVIVSAYPPGNNNSNNATSQSGSRSATPRDAIQFRLSGDFKEDDDMEPALQ